MKSFRRNMYIGLIVFTIFVGCRITVDPEGGKIQANMLHDGEYEGYSEGGPVKVKVKISIRDQKLESIDILKHSTMMGRKAEKPVVENILAEQSTDVDAVSGATVSSRVIMNAVQNAIERSAQP